eukprot:TRINITY_DN122004_c0_g1_i1.p1 TRINITY_DN122004_c0_g1~~TRINITY_DN122004_c0_g1_i1.p1  ORF type:complete len:519 (+),score=54.47 TRINITY_DN122004_c0_g1_i1:43-1599(+)
MAKKAKAKPLLWSLNLPTALAVLSLLAFFVFLAFLAFHSDLSEPIFLEHALKHRLVHAGSQPPGLLQDIHHEDTEVLSVKQEPLVQQADIGASPAQVAGAVSESHKSDAEGLVDRPPAAVNRIEWTRHQGKSCQGYAKGDSTARSLADSKIACLENEDCLAIECNTNTEDECTLRGSTRLVDYPPADCYEEVEVTPDGVQLSVRVHPVYQSLLKEYPFQQVTTQSGQQVNVILVRSQMNPHQTKLYQKYKDDILFLGISSMNDYPFGSEYVGMFPGFLHMMREPEKSFPPQVKTILLSQSDFQLPTNYPFRDYSVPKKYDFTYSASDCDVESDGNGWCGWSKNWTFVKSALHVMCSPEFNLRGVLVATKNKANTKAYSIPPECKDRIIQTTFLADQRDYFNYLRQSRFAFLPQVHDASPRVSTQALALDVPILMNYHIMGGWKYVTEKTGEFFHDMGDFKESLRTILRNSDIPHRYEPRKWVFDNYGNDNSGKRLLEFVKAHFSHRVRFPKHTRLLLT